MLEFFVFFMQEIHHRLKCVLACFLLQIQIKLPLMKREGPLCLHLFIKYVQMHWKEVVCLFTERGAEKNREA